MNTAPATSGPRSSDFVAAVRRHFADLDPEEREELLGGLEADIADLVAERGPGALGDPDAYAAELRAAAGPAVRRSGRPRPVAGVGVERCSTRARRRWDAGCDRPARRPVRGGAGRCGRCGGSSGPGWR